MKNTWFPKLGAVVMATEDEAGTCTTSVGGGYVTINYDSFSVSRDLVSSVCLRFGVGFPSAPHKLMQ